MSPERGVLQLATNAVLNAIWDLWAKAEGKPLWRLVVDFTPEEFVRTMDFRYVTDVLTPEQALEMLKKMAATKAERMQLALQNKAIPAYNTSAGWLGHSDSKVSLQGQQIVGGPSIPLKYSDENQKLGARAAAKCNGPRIPSFQAQSGPRHRGRQEATGICS